MRGKPSATKEEDLFGGSSSSQIHLVLHLGLRSWSQLWPSVVSLSFLLVKGKQARLQVTSTVEELAILLFLLLA